MSFKHTNIKFVLLTPTESFFSMTHAFKATKTRNKSHFHYLKCILDDMNSYLPGASSMHIGQEESVGSWGAAPVKSNNKLQRVSHIGV